MVLLTRFILAAATLVSSAAPAPTPDRASVAAAPVVRAIPLPGAPTGGVFMDYIAYDPALHRVWVPAGNTASVDVVDDADGKVTRIEGFATAEVERQGAKRTIGPSAATVGARVVYIGNRSWTADTAPGARNAVATENGTAYLTDSREGKILVVTQGSP